LFGISEQLNFRSILFFFKYILAFSETNGFFRFEARVLKPLNKRLAEKSGLYKKLVQKESFEFGAKYPQAGEIALTHFEKFKIWGFYCPFTLWFDPDLVGLVENSEDEERKRIAYELLWRG
jgi:hypothetical protein